MGGSHTDLPGFEVVRGADGGGVGGKTSTAGVEVCGATVTSVLSSMRSDTASNMPLIVTALWHARGKSAAADLRGSGTSARGRTARG